MARRIYAIIDKLTNGGLDASPRGAPVSGEITMESFTKIITNLSIDYESTFLDIGSGHGKPLFHIATSTHCKRIIGIEVEEHRFLVSLRALICMFTPNIFILRGDILDVISVYGVTHVYCFSIGMPETAIQHIVDICNTSKILYLSIYTKPHIAIDLMGLGGCLHHKLQVRMVGSGERHTCYIYKMDPTLHGLKSNFIESISGIHSSEFEYQDFVLKRIQSLQVKLFPTIRTLRSTNK